MDDYNFCGDIWLFIWYFSYSFIILFIINYISNVSTYVRNEEESLSCWATSAYHSCCSGLYYLVSVYISVYDHCCCFVSCSVYQIRIYSKISFIVSFAKSPNIWIAQLKYNPSIHSFNVRRNSLLLPFEALLVTITKKNSRVSWRQSRKQPSLPWILPSELVIKDNTILNEMALYKINLKDVRIQKNITSFIEKNWSSHYVICG